MTLKVILMYATKWSHSSRKMRWESGFFCAKNILFIAFHYYLITDQVKHLLNIWFSWWRIIFSYFFITFLNVKICQNIQIYLEWKTSFTIVLWKWKWRYILWRERLNIWLCFFIIFIPTPSKHYIYIYSFLFNIS